VQVGSAADLEDLLAVIRSKGKVSTHTTVVLSVPYEDRPVV
jgi:Lrp/AsnC family leucine-responsive transcriptional regulator